MGKVKGGVWGGEEAQNCIFRASFHKGDSQPDLQLDHDLPGAPGRETTQLHGAMRKERTKQGKKPSPEPSCEM